MRGRLPPAPLHTATQLWCIKGESYALYDHSSSCRFSSQTKHNTPSHLNSRGHLRHFLPLTMALHLEALRLSRARRLGCQILCDSIRASASQSDFVSSRTLKCREISLIQLLLQSYTETAAAAASDESYTKMVELTTMLSSTMRAFETYPTSVDGMFRECIRMCDLFHELRGLLTSTHENTEILYTTASLTPTDLGDLLIAAKEVQENVGRTSQMLQQKTNFLKKSRQMIRDLWLSRFETSNHTPSGSIRVYEDSTNSRSGSQSPPRSLPNFVDSLSELENLEPVGTSRVASAHPSRALEILGWLPRTPTQWPNPS